MEEYEEIFAPGVKRDSHIDNDDDDDDDDEEDDDEEEESAPIRKRKAPVPK